MFRSVLILCFCLPLVLGAEALSESERKQQADIYLEQGVKEFQAGDYEAAARSYVLSLNYWVTDLAAANLCNLFLNGTGVPQDFERARTLCEAAASLDNPNAITMLGDIYRYGLGVSADLDRAIELFRRGAELEHPHSLYSYGLILMDSNPEEGKRMLERSAALEYQPAEEALSEIRRSAQEQ